MGRKNKPPRKRRVRRQRSDGEATALDLVEEGVHLLRRAPLWSWCAYFLGAGPFVLGFLYFWSDMAHSGLAPQHVVSSSFLLAMLFVWMRFCEVLFLRGLWAVIRHEPPEKWTAGRVVDAFFAQAQWQTTALLMLPIFLVLTFPFSHAFGVYQNLMSLEASGVEPSDDNSSRLSRASKLAGVWPGQGWALLGMLTALGFMLFLNWYTVILFAPQLLKSLFGLDSIVIRSAFFNLNSTTFSIALGLTYLTTEPLIKATFLLRCHYAQSRHSGEDLLYAARQLAKKTARAASRTAAVFGAVFCLIFEMPEAAAEESAPAAPAQLNESIDNTLSQPEYIWRFPKEEVSNEIEAPTWWTNMWKFFRESLKGFIDWIDRLFQKDSPRETNPSRGLLGDFSVGTAKAYLLIAVAVIALIWGAYKLWVSRVPAPVSVQAMPTAEAIPDLTREDLTADVLPRNRWLEIAKDLIAERNFRFALRALFLAELAHLSDEGLISLSRYKSNLDYSRELTRRGGSTPLVLDAYRDSARLFDGVWYGEKPVGEPEIERMKSCLYNIGLAW
ncbi:MAG: hypothetical protein ACQKBV_00290 [Puniceicoccales bacterium]